MVALRNVENLNKTERDEKIIPDQEQEKRKQEMDYDALANEIMSLKLSEHQCSECRLVCKTAGGLKKHMTSKHAIDKNSDLKTFKCEKCGKGFKGNNNLTRHMKGTKCANK